MHILNLEDSAIKKSSISRALKRGGLKNVKIDWVRNLEEGLGKIETQIKEGKPYDLIITDMWYPEYEGGSDAQSGKALIEKAQENGWEIPIILCSSFSYGFPEIFGCVHYSEKRDWENELVQLVKQL